MQFVRVLGPNGAADSSQWDVKSWLLRQGAAKELHPLDILLEAWVDIRAIIFSVFPNASTSSRFVSNTEILLGKSGQLYFCTFWFYLSLDSSEKWKLCISFVFCTEYPCRISVMTLLWGTQSPQTPQGDPTLTDVWLQQAAPFGYPKLYFSCLC